MSPHGPRMGLFGSKGLPTSRSTNGHWRNLDETTKIFLAKDHRKKNTINTVPSDIRLVHKERR
jgi:hypothetical protein